MQKVHSYKIENSKLLPIAKYILNFRLYFTPFQMSFQHFPYGTNSLPVILLYFLLLGPTADSCGTFQPKHFLALAVWFCYIQLGRTYPNLIIGSANFSHPDKTPGSVNHSHTAVDVTTSSLTLQRYGAITLYG